jgi:hypothetical protein
MKESSVKISDHTQLTPLDLSLATILSPRQMGYQPLTKRDIRNLLRRAKQTKSFGVRGDVLARLHQGIKGSLWPRLGANNPVASEELEVTKLFFINLYKEPTKALVNEFYKVMNWS